MGTQFTSRLSKTDTRTIQTRIREIRRSFDTAVGVKKPTESKKKTGKRKKAERPEVATALVDTIPAAKRRELGDKTASSVLDVHDFPREFRHSDAFLVALRFLSKLHSSARWDGFQVAMKDLDLQQGRFPGVLVRAISRQLKELDEARGSKDPLRVVAQDSVTAFFARVLAAKAGAETAGATDAERFGRKLETVNLNQLVSRFVGEFLKRHLGSMLQKASLERGEDSILQLGEQAMDRLVSRAIKRIEGEKLSNQPEKVRDAVAEELESLIAKSPPPRTET